MQHLKLYPLSPKDPPLHSGTPVDRIKTNNAHTNKKSKVVWQVANEIRNRKKSKRSILKVNPTKID